MFGGPKALIPLSKKYAHASKFGQYFNENLARDFRCAKFSKSACFVVSSKFELNFSGREAKSLPVNHW